MSKRFGRNQKRALQNRIAQLESDVSQLDARVRHKDEIVYAAQSIVETVQRISPDSSLLDPRHVEGYMHDYLLPKFNVMGLSIEHAMTGSPAKELLPIVSLYELELSLQTDSLLSLVHMIATYNGEESAYTLTAQAFENLDPRDITRHVEFKVREIVLELIAHLKKGGMT